MPDLRIQCDLCRTRGDAESLGEKCGFPGAGIRRHAASGPRPNDDTLSVMKEGKDLPAICVDSPSGAPLPGHAPFDIGHLREEGDGAFGQPSG